MGGRCFAIQAQRAGAKNQPSPEGLGDHRQAVERRRCGTPLSAFVHWERSRGICSSTDLLWKRAIMFNQNCHLACPGVPWDRTTAQWRDLRVFFHTDGQPA
jgi:hypothetical protein